MLTSKKYTISDLKNIITESNNESKPVIGKNVIRDDASNNTKAVKDIMKATQDSQPKSNQKRTDDAQNENDTNKTTLDLKFDYEPSKQYKERVKSQVHGFPSVDNEKNSDVNDYDALDTETNKKFYDDASKNRKNINKKEQEDKHAGLKTHNLPKEEFKNDTLYTESKKMKRLHFKKTTFLSEAQMLKKIPEDYKKDGNKFIMKDATNTEYVVECVVDDRFNFAKFNVLSKFNKENVNEELNRIKSLYEYNSSDYSSGTSSRSRKQEDTKLNEMVSRIKDLEK